MDRQHSEREKTQSVSPGSLSFRENDPIDPEGTHSLPGSYMRSHARFEKDDEGSHVLEEEQSCRQESEFTVPGVGNFEASFILEDQHKRREDACECSEMQSSVHYFGHRLANISQYTGIQGGDLLHSIRKFRGTPLILSIRDIFSRLPARSSSLYLSSIGKLQWI